LFVFLIINLLMIYQQKMKKSMEIKQSI